MGGLVLLVAVALQFEEGGLARGIFKVDFQNAPKKWKWKHRSQCRIFRFGNLDDPLLQPAIPHFATCRNIVTVVN